MRVLEMMKGVQVGYVFDQPYRDLSLVEWRILQHRLGVVAGVEVAPHLREGTLHRAARVG